MTSGHSTQSPVLSVEKWHLFREKAEWYATGILDTGTDKRVGNDECIQFGLYYASLAEQFYSEQRPDLPNIRTAWPEFIRRAATAKAVIAGAKLLDKSNFLVWWHEHCIDINTLDMSEPEKCVLGQLSGDWSEGLWQLMELEQTTLDILDFAYAYGFDVEPNLAAPAETIQYTDLTDMWVTVIKQRRDAAGSDN